MPTYQFYCDSDIGGCNNKFEVTMMMSELDDFKPVCTECTRHEFMRLQLYTPYVYDSSPRTVGTLSERNTRKMSRDEKNHIYTKNTEYRDKRFSGSLPDGGKLYPVDNENKRMSNKPKRKSKRKPNNDN